MKEYHKIDTVYKRDQKTNYKNLLIGDYSQEVFQFLENNTWIYTEKVDGTNIRVMIDDDKVTFGGKTDNAQIPAPLVTRLEERFLSQKELLKECFTHPAILYGEGYGPKIQNGGNYRKDVDFVLFDILINGWWLKREDIEGIAKRLNLDVVPIIGTGTLHKMVALAREGFNSTWGNFQAEGIVARPEVELKNRNGDRVITKIKHKDF